MKIEMSMNKMIDAEDGIVTIAVRRFKTGIKVGDSVEIREPEDNKSFSGVINSIDADGHVSIEVDWASERSSV